MRQASIIVILLAPLFLLAGCDGSITIGTAQPDSPVAPSPEPDGRYEVLAFTAKWCAACQQDKAQLEEMRRRGTKVTEIDIDEHPELARRYGVTQLPTYVVLEDGVEVRRTGNILLLLKILAALFKFFIL